MTSTIGKISLEQEVHNRILTFNARFKETYKCPDCRKKVKFWPFVVNNRCPFCGKPLLQRLMEKGKITFTCEKCGAPVTSLDTLLSDYCPKCLDKTGGIPFRDEAFGEALTLSPYKLSWVKCDKCHKKSATRDLKNGELFPLAGFCKKCGKIICWNCAVMHHAAEAWEANEITALATAGSLIALHSADGKTMTPKCPRCGTSLDSIVNSQDYDSYKLIKSRDVKPL